MRQDPSVVVWLTGLPGAGKTTLAARLAEVLVGRGLRVEQLDGDSLREIFPGTGFTRAEREEHVRRAGMMASALERRGVTVVASLVSPYQASRRQVRSLCRNFVEVHVATPLDVCERRDPKGLYAKARRGEIRNFTGIDDPYEPPERAEVVVDASRHTVEESLQLILTALEPRLV